MDAMSIELKQQEQHHQKQQQQQQQQQRTKKITGYAAGAPWRFRGRALYQMHLVKAETARRHVPAQLKLVQAFGYTLGGFYLAHYDDSPAGPFDELVVIAGIVWNPPTSCAWAARVLVNSMEACTHGKREVGLPSHFANFSQNRSVSEHHKVNISQAETSPFLMSLPGSLSEEARTKGAPIKFSLPSFSGKTEQQPNLLKYCCDLSCKVSMTKPASISCASNEESDILEILRGKPVLAMRFEDMEMGVKTPTLLNP